MGSIRVRKDSGLLFFDFRYQSNRCREQSMLSDTTTNRRNMEKVLARIESEIKLGTFDYARFFPNSPLAAKFKSLQEGATIIAETGPMTIPTAASQQTTPFFGNFAEEWFLENEIRWKRSYKRTQRVTLSKYLLPHFGEKEISRITKGDLLKFRSSLAKAQNGAKESISTDRINHIMTPLRMILDEAADRYNFNTPYIGIKQLRVPKSDVYPFSLEEVKTIIANVRKDFANYFTVRFLTGMRTSEIDGLKWQYVDFSKRVIRIRETLVDGMVETTKTPESVRDISMSQPVFDAMTLQFEVTKDLGGYVFCNNDGVPLARRNVMNRVWYPLLRYLGLKKRKPYQTRHTTATLWLASGENPEWIARQMGHTNTRMLFTVYSRFVPNLTRNDGSAFDRFVSPGITNV